MAFLNNRVGLGVVALLAASVATGAMASSHREAPGITQQPKIDGTDFYMFRSYEPSREGYVTLIANYQPIQAPYGGPNYFTMDEDALYEIHIDNDGDAIEDITFQFDFRNTLAAKGAGQALQIGDKTVPIPLRQSGPITSGDSSAQNEFENFTLTMVEGDRRSGKRSAITQVGGDEVFDKPIDYIGDKTLPDYDNYANDFIVDAKVQGCEKPVRVFVGQRAEAFAVNLGPIFDLVNFVPLEGSIEQSRERNDDLFGKVNVTSLALEVPISCLTDGDNPIIGAWTTSSLPQAEIEDPSPTYGETSVYGGAYVQQSRLSAPLVNELVIGLPDKDLFNAAEPMIDSALAFYVTNPTLPALLESLFGVKAPTNIPRGDLVAAFLTGINGLNQPEGVTPSEMMRLNTAIPATPRADQDHYGVIGEDLAGFPNGRRPGDDVVDIALRVVMGVLCHPVPLGAELSGDPSIDGTDADLVPLGLCPNGAADAPSGDLPYTDGAPLDARDFVGNAFPYLNTPIPGATGADAPQ